ncbi:DUF7284 family protein [Halobaculum litoreum]|uniref:SIMPL domain-containing protein n=1 Tax=Halobaculum litoreum TaxID=3031998 RepID=A0ABD5XUG2_9EURY
MTGSLLDVCLALLLVSAAAVTVVDVDTGGGHTGVETDDRAGGAADTLLATTATIGYSVGPSDDPSSPEAERVAHATLAEHLARAAVRSATVEGTRLSSTPDDYLRAVRGRVARTLGPRTSVRVRWRPLRGVGVAGGVRVGPRPPAATPISATHVTVPVGRALDGGGTRTAAATTVEVLFPPERIAAAARGDTPSTAAVVDRYRRAGESLGVDAVTPLERGGPERANRVLADALAARTTEARGSTAAAGREHTPRRVVIVVRTWEP